MTASTGSRASGAQAQVPPPRRGRGRRIPEAYLYGNPVVVTALAFVCALVVGAVLIVVADQPTRTALGYFFAAPGDTFANAWRAVADGYGNLFRGAIIDPATLGRGDPVAWFTPISNTLLNATPLILGGLAVGVAFQTGSVQHRRPGAADHRRHLRRLRGVRVAPARRPARAHRPGRQRSRRGAVGRPRRLAQGAHRGARGDHHDHRSTTSRSAC